MCTVLLCWGVFGLEVSCCRRADHLALLRAGQQALLLYKSTMEYFKPMMRSLRKRDIPADLLAGIWMIVRDIKDRNYLHANTIYMSLAVGVHPVYIDRMRRTECQCIFLHPVPTCPAFVLCAA